MTAKLPNDIVWRRSFLKALSIIVPALILVGVGLLVLFLADRQAFIDLWHQSPELLLTGSFWMFVLVGFLAQMIDGALGMAYGVSSTSFLLGLGIPPATASASVHIAEVFTTGVSGISHLRLGNVNLSLLKRLIIPGVLGAVAGAYFLSDIGGSWLKPVIAAYLLLMGVRIIYKALNKTPAQAKKVNLSLLAITGGFVDAVGGGGWGPVVNTTLIGSGYHARYSIGSVNTAEFFVALASAGTFVLVLGVEYLHIILGLILGGLIAAPFAALLVRFFPARRLMLIVGILIVALSLRTIILTL